MLKGGGGRTSFRVVYLRKVEVLARSFSHIEGGGIKKCPPLKVFFVFFFVFFLGGGTQKASPPSP